VFLLKTDLISLSSFLRPQTAKTYLGSYCKSIAKRIAILFVFTIGNDIAILFLANYSY